MSITTLREAVLANPDLQKQRDVIRLREEGLTYAQIGSLLGKSKQAVAYCLKAYAPHLRKLPVPPVRQCEAHGCSKYEGSKSRGGLCRYHRTIKAAHGDPNWRYVAPVVTVGMRLEALHQKITKTEGGHWMWQGKVQAGRPWCCTNYYGGERRETGIARIMYREHTGIKLGKSHVFRQCGERLCVAPGHHKWGRHDEHNEP